MHLVQTPSASAPELKKTHIDILRYLRDNGAENALMLWAEEDVDALFKRRPRYVRLAPGQNPHPIIEITREGLLALKQHEESSNGHRKAK